MNNHLQIERVNVRGLKINERFDNQIFKKIVRNRLAVPYEFDFLALYYSL